MELTHTIQKLIVVISGVFLTKMVKKNKKIPNWIWIILVLAVFLFASNMKGCTLFGNGVISEAFTIKEYEVLQYNTCTELCNSKNYDFGYAGESVDDCRSGEYFINYGYVGEHPTLSCCCYDEEEETTTTTTIYGTTTTTIPFTTTTTIASGETYTYSECDILRDDYGKDFSAIVADQSACEDYGFEVCNNYGTYMSSYDWFPINCCIVNCYGVETPLYGTYTFPECYAMAMDYTHPDGTSHPLDGGAISDDGETWDEIECYWEAMADCDDMITINMIRDNCCMWECYIPP